MIITLRCVGIDVSKHHLDIFDEGIGVSERVANAPHAIKELWRVGDAMRWSSLRPPASTTSSSARRCCGRHPRRPDQSCPGSRLCPCQRPTRQDRPDRRADARRLRARHAARHRAGLYACPQRLGATGKTADQLVLMRAQEKNRRSEAGDRAMVEHIYASSNSSITRSPRSKLTSARSSKPNRKSRTMHN